MKNIFKKLLSLVFAVIVSFILYIFLALFYDDYVAVDIVFLINGIYVIYLILKHYIQSVKRFNSDGILPEYIQWLLVALIGIMSSDKSLHTRLLVTGAAGKSVNLLGNKNNINLLIYTLIIFSMVTFSLFFFGSPILEYIKFKDGIINFLLGITFLNIIFALIINFLRYIYDINCIKFSKKSAIIKVCIVIAIVFIPLYIGIKEFVLSVLNHF